MATRVSGPLHTITDYAPHIASVWVRPASPRPYDGGLILGAQVPADFSNGTVSFTAKPGPGVLLLQGYDGPPETHPILVGENPSATLEEVVRAADLAGDEDVVSLARMVAQVQDAASTAAEDAVSAGRDADRSAAGATTATEKAAEAAGSATRAETAEAGAVKAEEGAVAAAIGVQTAFHQYTGTGFPEGVVSAPVGAIYTDTAATAGAVRWIKTSGTGNTGWKVEYGDTGWRIIMNNSTDPDLIDDGQILIRRVVNTVEFVIDNVLFLAAGLNGIVPYPFRPEVRLRSPLQTYTGAESRNSFQVTGIGYVNIYGPLENALTGSVTYTTDKPWRSTLPGTPL